MAHRAAYREAHPLYAVIAHWINLIGFVFLILSGFYIHFPFVPGFMGVARGIHMFFGVVIIINAAIRICASFFMKTAQSEGTREVDLELKNWMLQKQNRHQLIPFIKYYLFLKKEHPQAGKFNPLQKLSYWAIPWLILFQGYTGLALWAPCQNMAFFQAGISLFGGLPGIRVLHYLFMFAFLAFVCVHVYLAIDESALINLMLFWKEHEGYVVDPETGAVIGYDDFSEQRQKEIERLKAIQPDAE